MLCLTDQTASEVMVSPGGRASHFRFVMAGETRGDGKSGAFRIINRALGPRFRRRLKVITDPVEDRYEMPRERAWPYSGKIRENVLAGRCKV